MAPINRQVNGVNQVLHFGASVRTREIGNDQPLLQYTQRGADLHLTNNVINTGRIGKDDTFWGLEAAALWGPFSLQGEYGHLDVDLPTGPFIPCNPPGADCWPALTIPSSVHRHTHARPEYNGWYMTGGWFFGGHKNYNKEGKWDRPTIDNPMRWNEGKGWGAVELVGKYDVLNMSDSAFNDSGGSAARPRGFIPACLQPGWNSQPSEPPASACAASRRRGSSVSTGTSTTTSA